MLRSSVLDLVEASQFSGSWAVRLSFWSFGVCDKASCFLSTEKRASARGRLAGHCTRASKRTHMFKGILLTEVGFESLGHLKARSSKRDVDTKS